ncbi:MAG TPA: AAA family ATPase, partial [Gemmatimonadales bacterium]|nr:AAA family ATPase [Gemmatimonadales bacterium]
MSPELAGYQLGEPVDHDGQTVTYAGTRLADHAPVLAVLPRSAHPAPETLDQLRAQFALLNRFDHPGVIRALALESTPDGAALVTDRPAAQSLRTLLTGQPLPLDRFLALGAEMAAAVAAVHAAGVIHRDLTPERFAVADGRSVVLGGFGRATPVPRQMHAAVSPGALAGTLTYLSPEQTGRMNRSVDFRTDLYSLGVILYEMLTGQPPFRAGDPLQLIHAHIARAPQPPGQLRPNCPEPLAAIVLKLLAKSAEDRYQSAAGLEADLRLCLEQMRAGRTVPELIPGQCDVPSRFQVPERLYGRAAEVKQLLQAFEGIGPGRSSLVLISGYSGIGKSSLVQELQRPAMERQAHFVVGKFDQFKRNVPFATLHLALRDLVRQVMTEDDSRIAAYRDRLLTAVGPNGQLLIDVVPEFARLIGPQPAAPELPPQETRNRFQRLLHQVVRAFCSESHPLCLFIDDLQWVDSATLEWLESTMLDGDTGWLLLLGAYRDHEVSPSHPLRLLVDRLAETASVEEIQLQPLDDNTLAQLVADALHQSVGEALPLARIISEKTRGNPFFVNQLLESLYREGAILFDAASRRWTVDLEQAAAAAASDNVVDFMTTRLERLAPASRDTLHLAACLGSTFELETLV